jgi:hypothetical protein
MQGEISMRLTIAQINQRNSDFWEKKNAEFAEGIKREPSVFREVMDEVRAEELRHAVYSRRPLEKVFIDVKASRERHQQEFAMRGVKARKPDKLNEEIHQIVKRRPDISCEDLLAELKAREKVSSIVEVTTEDVVLSDGKVVPLTGLKDRLSRAKKNMRGSANRATGKRELPT